MEVLYRLNRGWTDMDDFVRILRRLKKDARNNKEGSVNDLRILYLMIPYCRDVIRGKGERDVSYRMIYAFYQVFPVLAIKAVHLLFRVRDGLPMVGSWCDIKYFCIFVERHSPLGSGDPLIAIMASIANNNIDNTEVAKWIPRECRHPYLFSVFVRDFFNIAPGKVFSSVKKGLYRKRVSSGSKARGASFGGCEGPSGDPSLGSSLGPSLGASLGTSGDPSLGPSLGGPGFPTWFMGKYVREAIRLIKDDIVTGESVEAIERKWRRLLKTFPHYTKYGLAVVDLDIGIPDEVLFHSIGFACLIAEKMGLKRIVLAGVDPASVDISCCDGFVGMVRVIWSFCEGRGVSRLREAVDLVKRGFHCIGDNDLVLFIFSERFLFDWYSVMNNRCIPVFWDMGNTFEIPSDFCLDIAPFIYTSGYASGLLIPFFSEKVGIYRVYESIMKSYSEWSDYFELFVAHSAPVDIWTMGPTWTG